MKVKMLKIDTEFVDVDYLVNQLKKGEIIISQHSTDWRQERFPLFWESIVLRIPTHAFYCLLNNNYVQEIAVGLLQLKALFLFLGNSFRLKGLQALPQYEGYTFDELPRSIHCQIEDHTVPCHIAKNRPANPKKFLLKVLVL